MMRPVIGLQLDCHQPIMPFDSVKYGNNRLGLAKWVTDKRNPLTATRFC